MVISRYKLYKRTFLVTLWVLITWGGVIQVLPPLQGLTMALTMACDIVILLLGVLTLRQRGDLIVVGSYLIIGIVSTVLVNRLSFVTFFNGSRDFFGLLFAIPILRYLMSGENGAAFRRSFDRQLYVWLWLQAVCIPFQAIVYGVGDDGGGTFGVGGSGMVSMLIYVISFYLITKRWDSADYLGSLRRNWVYVFLLFPTFLNETKVSFILIVAYFLLLLRFDRTLFIKLAYIVPVAIIGILGLGAVYFSVTGADPDEVLSMDFAEEYLYGLDLDQTIDIAIRVQDGDFEVDPHEPWAVDIPRIAKLVLISPYLRDEPGGLALGAGVGQFKGVVGDKMTRFARLNWWLLGGSRPMAFMILVQLGYVGLLWFYAVLGRDTFQRHCRRRFSRQMILLVALCVLILQIYNESMRYYYFWVLLFYPVMALKFADNDTDTQSTSSEKSLANVESKSSE